MHNSWFYVFMQSEEEMMLKQTPNPKYLGNQVKYFKADLCVSVSVCLCLLIIIFNYYRSTPNWLESCLSKLFKFNNSIISSPLQNQI